MAQTLGKTKIKNTDNFMVTRRDMQPILSQIYDTPQLDHPRCCNYCFAKPQIPVIGSVKHNCSMPLNSNFHCKPRKNECLTFTQQNNSTQSSTHPRRSDIHNPVMTNSIADMNSTQTAINHCVNHSTHMPPS